MKKIVIFIFLAVFSVNAMAGSCRTVKGNLFAISENYLDRAISLVIDKDYDALQQLIDLGVVGIFSGNTEVFTVDSSWTKTQFRLKGDNTIFWTVNEGLKCY